MERILFMVKGGLEKIMERIKNREKGGIVNWRENVYILLINFKRGIEKLWRIKNREKGGIEND